MNQIQLGFWSDELNRNLCLKMFTDIPRLGMLIDIQ